MPEIIMTGENPIIINTVDVDGDTDLSPYSTQKAVIIYYIRNKDQVIIAKGAENLLEPNLVGDWTQLDVAGNVLTLQLTSEETSNLVSKVDKGFDVYSSVSLRSSSEDIISQSTVVSIAQMEKSVAEGIV